MRHTKLEGLMTPIERLGRVSAATYDAATRPRTAPSGTISYDNADGTRTVIGPQTGSATMATHVGDVTPPGRPLGVAGASSAGVVYVAWGGELEGGTPADFDHVSVYMSVEGVSELVGTLTEAGIVSTVPMATTATVEVWATAEDDACLADGTPAHNVSEESDHATVAVTQGEDAAAVDALRDRVSAVEAKAEAAKANAATAQSTADRAQSTADAALDNAGTANGNVKAVEARVSASIDGLDVRVRGVSEAVSAQGATVRDVERNMSFGLDGLVIGAADSASKVRITEKRETFEVDGKTVLALDGDTSTVEASALKIGGYVWTATNGGKNLTLVYRG